MPRTYRIVDADAHVNPPADFWREYLPREFHDIAPRIESGEHGERRLTWSALDGLLADGESAYFLMANRNKRSVAIDLSRPEGQALVRRLALSSDILVENFRTGALAKFGLDYEDLRRDHPGLIYCSISGYGRQSPMAHRPGYDFIAQAEGGMMSVTGSPDGEPVKTAVAVTDLFAGMNAAQAILAALVARLRTGQGQHIDIALLDGQVAALVNVASEYLATGKQPQRHGNAHPSIVPYQVFKAADAHFVLTLGNDQQFETFCRRVIDRPELAQDPRFQTNMARVRERGTLVPLLAAILAERPAAHWLARLDQAGLPAARIRDVPETLAAPEVLARDMVQEVQHPTSGTIRLVGSPLKLSGTPVREPVAPPLLGQHTRSVLGELLGLTPEALADLQKRNIIHMKET